MNFCTIAS